MRYKLFKVEIDPIDDGRLSSEALGLILYMRSNCDENSIYDSGKDDKDLVIRFFGFADGEKYKAVHPLLSAGYIEEIK